jgi:hypothetical protein
MNFGAKVENLEEGSEGEGSKGDVDAGRKGSSLTSKRHSKVQGAVKQKATINQLVILWHKIKETMPPIQQIYSSLLTSKNLDYHGGKVWENRMKSCTTYTKFGRHYCQQMRFLIAKQDGEDFTLFHNAYHREYYKLLQWERKGGDNGPVEPMATETYKKMLPSTTINGRRLMRKGHSLGLTQVGKQCFVRAA